jgi:[protein-PII] uridylyltransferase
MTTPSIQDLAERRIALIDSLWRQPRALSWCRDHTEIVDQAILRILDDLRLEHAGLRQIDVVATGGYGRSEMAPYSDIDITVIPQDDASAEVDRAIRAFFQELHSTISQDFGLSVGYAYRLVSDAPGIDAKTRTGLLDARLIAGTGSQLEALLENLDATMASGEFILAKVKERESAFEKFHDTPLVVEPNLKEGAGGVRCFHASNWIRTAIGERESKPTRAFESIVRMRNLLHAVAGKAQESLTRARQSEICAKLECDPDAMMTELTLAGSKLFQGYLDTKSKVFEARFSLSRAVLAVRGEARMLENADAGEAAVGIAIATELELRVSDLQPSASQKISGPAAAYAVSTGEKTIRNLDRAGLIKVLIPELDACRTLMPHDNVHRYTVFEHTLQVVRQIDGLANQPFLRDIWDSLHDVEALYVAALLHDVGKIDAERPHSESGEEIARQVCSRWHLSADFAETVAWLVKEHLTMMRFIRLRDLLNPETIREFADIVKDQDRLDLLTLLTYADVNAVAPGAWTAAQESFLQQLYRQTSEALASESPIPLDSAQHRQRLLRQLKEEVAEGDLKSFVESLPSYYLASTTPDLVKLHYQLAKRAAQGEPTVEMFSQSDLGATDITVCARDEKALLSRLLGILYAFDLSVIAIRACTTETETPVALDTFTVSFGGRPVPNATRASVSSAIVAMLKGDRKAEAIMRERGKDPERDQEVFSYTFNEGYPAVLEVRAPRGRGMPYRFSRLIAAQGWNTFAARVGQWADSGAATFYIGKPDGVELTRKEVEKALGK